MEINNSNKENNNFDSNISKSTYYKITLTLPEDLDHLLFEIGQIARSRGGHRLPKTLIIRALIRILKELDINLDEVKTEEQFYKSLRDAIKKYT